MPRETRVTMDQLAAAAMEDEASSTRAGGFQLVMNNHTTQSWQETFRQLHDLQLKGKSPPPRLVKWMDAQLRRYKMYGIGRKKSVGIIKYRIAQLNSIDFDWFRGDEKRSDRDPRPTVILPPSQRPTQPSYRASQVKEYLPAPTHRHNKSKNKKAAKKPRPPQPAYTHTPIEIPMHDMDRKQLLSAGFPEQLFHMVNGASERCPHIIDWLPDGSGFEIHDTKNVGNFIRQYFRHSNVSSLRRMLHLYTFSTTNNVYHHPHFHRDSSLAIIKRNVVTSASLKNDSNSNKEILVRPIRSNDALAGDNNEETVSPLNDRKTLLNLGFPEQLFRMVNDAGEKYPHLINWLPDGTAFEIYDTKNVGNFIRHYFRHGKVSSLRRMLHLYQFSTLNNVFRHAHFHRDRNLADIKRYVVKKG